MSFEWLRYCDGWSPAKNAAAKQPVEQLPRAICFHGCDAGLADKKSVPVKAPRRVIADRCEFDDSPRRFCDGNHERAEARGHDAKDNETRAF